MNTDSINVYFYHRFEELVKYPETIDQLNKLKEHKLINKIGVSVYGNNEFEFAINSPEIDVIQLPFNLLDNFSQRGKLLKRAKQKNKEIQVRSVFLQGLFFKDINSFPNYLYPLKTYIEEIRIIAKVSSKSIEELALKYVLSEDLIDNVIIGVDTRAQLENNFRYMGKLLDYDVKERI